MKHGVVWIVTDKTSSVLRVSTPGGKKVDITQYNTRNLPEGAIQNGIVYDEKSVSEIFGAQLVQVIDQVENEDALTSEAIGDVYVAISGDRIKTAYLYLEDFKPGELSKLDVQRIEEAFGAPLTKLRFFPEMEAENGYVFHAARNDILDPYLSIVKSLKVEAVSVLPIGVCLKEALSQLVTSPSVIVYGDGGEVNVFAATPNSTVKHSVWAMESVSKENLDDAVREMMKSSEDLVGVPFERVLVIETDELGGDEVKQILHGLGVELAFFEPSGSSYIGAVELLVAKGMLTKAIVNDEAGFGINPMDSYELKVKGKEAEIIRAPEAPGTKKEYKVAFLSTALAAVMLVTGLSLLWEFYLREDSGGPSVEVSSEALEAGNSDIDGVMGVIDVQMQLPEEVIEEAEEEMAPEPEYTKEQIKVVVLNGNGRTGEAKRVAKMLQDAGFQIEKTGNAEAYSYSETTILAPTDLEVLAEEASGIVSARYPLAHVETSDGLEPETIVVVLGQK